MGQCVGDSRFHDADGGGCSSFFRNCGSLRSSAAASSSAMRALKFMEGVVGSPLVSSLLKDRESNGRCHMCVTCHFLRAIKDITVSFMGS